LRWLSAAILGLLFAPTAAEALALACSIPDRIPVPRLEQPKRGEPVRRPAITGYLLSMSWSPQHCADVRDPRDARDRFQCSGENGRFGWVLHGLWPETDTSGYPQWCRPAKIVPQPVLRQHLCMTPSAQLLQHEWAKHGTCMSPNPAAYFRSADILFRAVRFPDMKALAAKPQTASSIRRAFAAVNRGGDGADDRRVGRPAGMARRSAAVPGAADETRAVQAVPDRGERRSPDPR
jgi:ribonuclease T2